MDEPETTHFLMQMEIEDEVVQDELDNGSAAAAAVIMVLGAEEASRLRAERRKPSRLYLCRPHLLPNPRIDTPWQWLYHSQDDRAYITTMGFDTATFELIISSGFGQRWYDTPIPRLDTNKEGSSRPGRRSLDASGALGLLLHYLNSTMHTISLQQIFTLIPSTVSCYITFGLPILLDTLHHMPDAAITWPRTPEEFEENNTLILARHPRLKGAFASIDGLKLPVQTSDDSDIENATYNGWLCEHFISSVLVFSPKG